uniref:Uncharacterized protein n=1 Tax=Varanus komodoensis TaxID=61221 RepID=A0A8D2IQT2_VARKO
MRPLSPSLKNIIMMGHARSKARACMRRDRFLQASPKRSPHKQAATSLYACGESKTSMAGWINGHGRPDPARGRTQLLLLHGTVKV